MGIHSNRLVFNEDDVDYAKLCLDITVYWRGSMFERKEGIIDFHQQAITLIGPHLRYYETDSMERAKPLRKDTLNLVPFWLQNPKAKRDIFILKLEGGTHPNEPSEYSFVLNSDEEEANPVGALRLMLPIDFISKSPEIFVDLVENLIKKLKFESGHAGYALNWDPEGDMEAEADQTMRFISKRFPGIDLSDLDATLIAMQNVNSPGIKCINWLTLLGNELTDMVGGVNSVKKGTVNCTVRKLDAGILIRAGEKPDIGDQNRKKKLTSYHSIGKLLARYRIGGYEIFSSGESAGENATEEWLGRFDE